VNALGKVSHNGPKWLSVFWKADVSSQKLINLLAIMCLDRLFFEYIHEVYGGSVVSGCRPIEKADIMRFFRGKQQQSEKIASWTDATLAKLGQSYGGCLEGAGLLGKGRTEPVILDSELKAVFKESGMEAYAQALVPGERF
jgi:hypothetical protein